MKILKLQIRNIASLPEADIDFTATPLAEAPLFLICGEIGAGKTTILNAICMALYDQVPALRNLKDSKHVDENFLSSYDARRLMRQGVKEAWIELTFVGNDTYLYKSRWSTAVSKAKNRKKPGELVNTKICLQCMSEGHQAIYGKEDSKKKIIEIIGLTFDQFCRTTILAQGEFSKFLCADDKEKADILEKITGADRFAQIGAAVYARMAAAKQTCEKYDAQVQAIQGLTPDEIDRFLVEKATANGNIDYLKAQVGQLSSQIAWQERLNSLQDKQISAEAKFRQAAQQLETDQAKQWQHDMRQCEKTVDIRKLLKDKGTAQTALEVCQEQIGQQGSVYQKLIAGIQYLQNQLDSDEQKKSELQNWLNGCQHLHETYRQIEAVNLIGNNISAAFKKIEKANDELKETQDKLTNSKSDLTDLERDLTEKQKQLEAKKAEAETAKAKVDANHEEEVNSKLTELNAEIREKTERKDKYIALANALHAYLDNEALISKTRKEALNLSSDIEKLADKLPTLTNDYNRLHQLYEGQMKLSDWVGKMRESFSQLAECPLCGSKVDHWHSDEIINNALLQAQELAQEAKDKLEAVQNEQSDKHAKLIELRTQLRVYLKEKVRGRRGIFKMFAGLRDTLQPSAINDELVSRVKNSTEALDNEIKVANSRHDELNDNLAKCVRDRNAYNQLVSQLNILKDQHQGVEHKISTEKAQIQVYEVLINNLRNQIQYDNNYCNTQLGNLRTKVSNDDITLENYSQTIDSLSDEAKTYKDKTSKLDRVTQDLQGCAAQIKSAKDILSPFAATFAKLGDIGAREVSNLATEAVNFATALNRLQGQSAAQQDAIDALEASIDKYFEGDDAVPRDEVARIMALNEQYFEGIKAELERLSTAKQEAKTALQVAQNDLEAHLASSPGFDQSQTVDELKQQSDKLNDDMMQRAQEVARIDEKLDFNNKQAEQLAALKQKLVEQTAVYNQWKLLNDDFGGAKGEGFRKIAQSYVLQTLLYHANEYLQMLTSPDPNSQSGRYTLIGHPGKLSISVCDSDNNYNVRESNSLSGGETFLVSLSLALGLSRIGKTGFKVETLFIDEGFGSLDGETLETVIGALTRLHENGQRTIGIISHLDLLKERIGTQIRLKKHSAPAHSTIHIVGAK